MSWLRTLFDPSVRLADAEPAVDAAMRRLLLEAWGAPTHLVVQVGWARQINFVSGHLARSARVYVRAQSPQEAAALAALGFGLGTGSV